MIDLTDQEKRVLQDRIEFLEEQRMILTIALDKIRARARGAGIARLPPLLKDIEVVCDVALAEAGDEDYYDD